MPAIYRICQLLIRGLRPVFTRACRIEGVKHIPAEGPVLFIGNHISYWDPFALIGYAPRKVYFLGKRELLRIPVLHRLFRALSLIGIERGATDIGAIREALGILEMGKTLAVYPEGTRGAGPTEPRNGVLLLAEKSRALLVPVAVSGLEKLFFKKLPWCGRPSVTVRFGEPFTLEEINPSGEAKRKELLKSVMQRVTDLLLD